MGGDLVINKVLSVEYQIQQLTDAKMALKRPSPEHQPVSNATWQELLDNRDYPKLNFKRL